jgi:spermidine/putrescine transport system permease protein
VKSRKLNLYGFLIYAFLYIPILVLVVFSFNENRQSSVWTGFSTKWYGVLFQNDALWEAVRNSLYVAGWTAVIGTVLGTLTAIGLARARVPGKGLIEALLYLPMILPDIVLGVGGLIFFSAIGLTLGLNTILAAHVGMALSYVVLVLRARLAGMDRALEEAAQDLGATPWQAFRHVTLPLLAPGIVAGALLAFTLSLDDFVLAFFMTGPGSNTLPVHVYSMLKKGLTPEVNALSTVLLVGTGLAVWLFQSLTATRTNIKKTEGEVQS